MGSKTAERIRRDLEQRGVAVELSRSISTRLARFVGDLTPDIYEAVLSGVVLANGATRREASASAEEPRGSADPPSDLVEVQRLMKAFTTELVKLEEALETLSAYVTRMRTQTAPTDRVLH